MKQHLLYENERKQRIKDLTHKFREEKELKVRRRKKLLTDVEKAKNFDHERLIKFAMVKFRNIVLWKIRNQNVSTEMQRRIIFRNVFVRWQQHTIRVWEQRKEKVIAFYSRHCLKIVLDRWRNEYLICRSNAWLADDWFHLRLSERIFQAWKLVTVQTRKVSEIKQIQAETHYNS